MHVFEGNSAVGEVFGNFAVSLIELNRDRG